MIVLADGSTSGNARNRKVISMPRLLMSLLIILFLVATFAGVPAKAETRYCALVQKDGALKVGGVTVRLHGIHIPPSGRGCTNNFRPIRCGSRAVLALDRRVDRFVKCDLFGRNADGTRDGMCRVKDRRDFLGPEVDLGAWMLYHGWAVALPHAPLEYFYLQEQARSRNRGVWGFRVDRIIFPDGRAGRL